MSDLTDAQFLQLLLVGGPILSLIATWMSLRTYGRLRQKSADRNVESGTEKSHD